MALGLFLSAQAKVLCWLLIKDRLSTRNILKRRNMALDSYNCVLCNDNIEETVEHLFLHCNFASHLSMLESVESGYSCKCYLS